MTEKNNFVYYGDTTVSKTRSNANYKVDLDWDTTIFVEADIVEEIISQYQEEPYLTAILLAYIEYARINRNKIKGEKKAKKIEPELLIRGISELLSFYDIERLIDICQELKWYDIERVIRSESSVNELNEIV